MKLLVKNFQAIENALLDVTGFTVITGKSNVGKSALMRAVSAALFGMPGDFFIKKGTLQCGVAISDTNLLVKWKKVQTGKQSTDRETLLEVNGTKHTKIGREHGLLTESLGFKEIRVGTERFRPQVADQISSIFLLGDSETVVAEVFKMLGRVDVVTEAQKLAKKDLKDTTSKLKIRNEDRDLAEIRLKELERLPKLRKEFIQLMGATVRTTGENLLRSIQLKRLELLRKSQPVTVPPEPRVGKLEQIPLLEKLKEYQGLLPKTIPDVPRMNVDVGLERSLDRLVGYQHARMAETAVSHELADLDQAISYDKDEKKQMETTMKTCPTCGKPFVI